MKKLIEIYLKYYMIDRSDIDGRNVYERCYANEKVQKKDISTM